jgi:hypothetical protein
LFLRAFIADTREIRRFFAHRACEADLSDILDQHQVPSNSKPRLIKTLNKDYFDAVQVRESVFEVMVCWCKP